jgi:arsenical pump membrane protein
MFLLIGNLTNILIGDGFHIGYFDFAAWMFLPTMAALVANYLIFRYMYRKDIATTYEPEKETAFGKLITNKTMVYVGIAVLAFVLVACGFASNFGLPLSAVTTIGIIIIYLAERRPLFRTRRISWRVVVFVNSLFIVVEGLVVSGVTTAIGESIAAIIGQDPVLATFFISLASAGLCNVVNNIPMTAMMVPITSGIAHTTDMQLAMAYSLVIGSNLGANITITGALAGILWIETAKVEKWSTGVTDFIKTGLTVTPIVILASAAVLALEIMLF